MASALIALHLGFLQPGALLPAAPVFASVARTSAHIVAAEPPPPANELQAATERKPRPPPPPPPLSPMLLTIDSCVLVLYSLSLSIWALLTSGEALDPAATMQLEVDLRDIVLELNGAL